MILNQNRRQPPQVAIGMAEPRIERHEVDTLLEIGLIAHKDHRSRNVPIRLQRCVGPGTIDFVQPLPNRRTVGIEPIPAVEPVGHVVLVIESVGHVQIDVEIRIVFVDQGEQRLHLRRLGLHEVAVQVQILRRVAPAHLLRSPLVRSAVRRRALMPVGVEGGYEYDVDLVEQAVLALEQHVADQHQHRVLAVDLARMDSRLHKEYRLCILELRAILGEDRRHQLPPLRRCPEVVDPHQLGLRIHSPQEGERVGIVGRCRQPCLLRRGDPRIVRLSEQLFARAAPRQRRRQESLRIECGLLCHCDSSAEGEGGKQRDAAKGVRLRHFYPQSRRNTCHPY